MDFQVIEVNGIYKVILIKAGFVVPLEFLNCGIQPDGFAQVKFIADSISGMEDFMSARIRCIIADDGIAH